MDLFELAARLTLDISEYEERLDRAGQVLGVFAGQVETGLGAASGLGQQALETLGGAVTGLAGTLQTVFLPGAQGILDSLGRLFGGEGSGIGLILSGVSGLAQRLVGTYPDLTAAGDGAAGAILTAITGRLPEFLAQGGAIAAQLSAGLSAGREKLAVAASPLLEAVKSVFTVGDWFSVGSGVASGIASGISGGISQIANAARSVAQNALAAAKNLLGIASPSRVFRDQVGAQIASGLAEGIMDGLNAVETAAGRLSGAALTGVSLTGPGGVVSLAREQGVAVTGSRGEAEHVPMSQGPMTILVQSVLDGRVIGETAYRYMQDKNRTVGL